MFENNWTNVTAGGGETGAFHVDPQFASPSNDLNANFRVNSADTQFSGLGDACWF